MKAKNKWAWTYSIIGIGQILAVLFPAAWILSGFGNWRIKLLYPLWLSMDDSRLDKSRPSGLAADYEIYLEGFKFKPWGVFMWHIERNRVWNLVELFKLPKHEGVGNQDIEVTNWISDELENGYGKKIEQDSPYAAGAGLKYVGDPKDYDDRWQVNKGEIIAKSTSIIGKGEIEYITSDGFKGWRKTSCRKVKPWWLFGKERWSTLYKGFNANRPAFKWKHQKVVPWGEWSEPTQ